MTDAHALVAEPLLTLVRSVSELRARGAGDAPTDGADVELDVRVLDGVAEALRWAMAGGVPHVVLADALAEAVHSIARVGGVSGDPYRLAGELGMPPWRVQKAQKQARRWNRDTVAEALRVVASLNADVKGAAASADYALESAVRAVVNDMPPFSFIQRTCSAIMAISASGLRMRVRLTAAR